MTKSCRLYLGGNKFLWFDSTMNWHRLQTYSSKMIKFGKNKAGPDPKCLLGARNFLGNMVR